ncbi:hypothetical protein Hypma_004786 [Hypsizygus marmoreus]|uniref:F-box domain-containing protein n=1 Tax=Hypsizygus marmoreus TaxID=39966 RepID=A0A369J3I0_HYPMA|nr:hypothetical protein Hypma_004786 [Hypsizygus marmoreus]
MLTDYPVEVSLRILTYLSASELSVLFLVSRAWKHLIDVNEASVYRDVAFQLGFISSPDELLSEAKQYLKRMLADVDGWKEFCRRCLQVEKNWAGRGHSSIKSFSYARDISYFKIDDENQFAITASWSGVKVFDLTGERILWSLPETYMPFEEWFSFRYDHGCLVFENDSGSIEIWRLTSTIASHDNLFPPSERQAVAASVAKQTFGGNGRGYFEPVSDIPFRMSDVPFQGVQTMRLVFPVLVVSAEEIVQVFDVTTGEVLQTIGAVQFENDGLTTGFAVDATVNDEHVFVAGPTEIRIFSRSDGKLHLTIPLSHECRRSALRVTRCDPAIIDAQLNTPLAARSLKLDMESYSANDKIREICVWGDTLIVLTKEGGVLIIDHIDQVVKGNIHYSELSLMIRLSSPSRSHYASHMEVHGGRIAVICAWGVYIISLGPRFDLLAHQLSDSFYDAQRLSISRAFPSEKGWNTHQDVHLTDTALFFISPVVPEQPIVDHPEFEGEQPNENQILPPSLPVDVPSVGPPGQMPDFVSPALSTFVPAFLTSGPLPGGDYDGDTVAVFASEDGAELDFLEESEAFSLFCVDVSPL